MSFIVRRWWWVLAGLGGAGLAGVAWIYLYPPVFQAVTFLLGRPHFADCTTAVRAEAALPSGRYRITEHVCAPSGRTMYVVFLLKTDEFMALPLLQSVDLPVPREVREHDSKAYEIVLAAALPDGNDRLPVTLDAGGFPVRYYTFVDGEPEE